VSEKPVRVGDLVKAKEITRDQVLAAVATIFDGQTAVPVSDGYALILPDLAKMTPFAREAIMSAMIEAGTVER
jgi:cytochrome c-type biogenesis protein CcmE